jgi:hypothetical protein
MEIWLCFLYIEDTENIKLVFCAVKDTIMQNALKEFNLAWTGTHIVWNALRRRLLLFPVIVLHGYHFFTDLILLDGFSDFICHSNSKELEESLESGWWTKSENPSILCVIHHRQNPVESTWFC